MRSWIGFSIYSILFLSLLFFCPFTVQAQQLTNGSDQPLNIYSDTYWSGASGISQNPVDEFKTDTTASPREQLPDPTQVMYKSLMVPGWGQVVNKQAWKVPIIYGALGGLVAYSVYLTRRYHDYRAAYYNHPDNPNEDLRFGPTPDYISENANAERLRSIRNSLRNRRDLVYVGTALAFGLNVIDAYVFAHMRSFDVSEDLSLRTRIKPSVSPVEAAPLVTVSVDFVY